MVRQVPLARRHLSANELTALLGGLLRDIGVVGWPQRRRADPRARR